MPEPTVYTLAVRFDGPPPSVHGGMDILGGTLVAVQFDHALKELDRYRTALEQISDGYASDDAAEIAEAALEPEPQPDASL